MIQIKKPVNLWGFFEEGEKKIVSFKLDKVLDVFQGVQSKLIRTRTNTVLSSLLPLILASVFHLFISTGSTFCWLRQQKSPLCAVVVGG